MLSPIGMATKDRSEHYFFIALDRTFKKFCLFCLALGTDHALMRHFVTQINTPHERHLFRETVQGEDETIDQFAVQLRRKAQQCDYGDQMEGQIRDQTISKSNSNELRQKLLKKKGQTLALQTL